MSRIREVVLNPHTQGEFSYKIGSNGNIVIDGVYFTDTPVVSDIRISIAETNYSIIEIFVANEVYAIYENVPYMVFCETSFHSKFQKESEAK